MKEFHTLKVKKLFASKKFVITWSLSCHKKNLVIKYLFLLSVCLFIEPRKITNEYLISNYASTKKANVFQEMTSLSYGKLNLWDSIIWTELANNTSN